MQAFESPFLSKTDDEIRTFMQENRNEHFASVTFTIFDKETVKNKTCRVGNAFEGCDKRILPTDFYTNMVIRVPAEMGVRRLVDEELLDTWKVYNREVMEEQHRAAREARQARTKEDQKD
jgi:hypothetical protein